MRNRLRRDDRNTGLSQREVSAQDEVVLKAVTLDAHLDERAARTRQQTRDYLGRKP